MIWFILSGSIIVLLFVYAHHETSRAAYYRAKAREIELRSSRGIHPTIIKKHQSKEEVNPSKNESVPADDYELSGHSSSPVEQHEEMPPIPSLRKWGTISAQFDESNAGDIMLQYESEVEQDREDCEYLSIIQTGAEEDLIQPSERASALENVELDKTALSFLKQIGAGDDSRTSSYPTEPVVQLGRGYEKLDEDLSELVQASLLVEDCDETVQHDHPAVTLHLADKPISGIYFVAGQIVEKYDEELCKLDDGTGSKVFSHVRFKHYEIGDTVTCQIQITKSGWNCIRVWGKESSKLLTALTAM